MTPTDTTLSPRRGIVLAGTVILDIVNIIDRWPAEDDAAFIQDTAFGAGGPPHNAAAGLMKLGAPFPVTLLGAVGDDSYADALISSAQGYGLDTSGIRHLTGVATSHTYVMSSAVTGRRTFFHQVGANARLDLDILLPRDDTAKLFYAGSPGIAPQLDESGGWPTLLREARARGFRTCIELVPVPPDRMRRLVPECLPHCDYAVVNDLEAQTVTGLAITHGEHLDWAAAEHACRQLLDMGVGQLAAVHHPDGGVAVSTDGKVAMRGSVKVPASDIIGTVGAGDAFYAGMLFGIHEDWPLEKCLDLGNAAAAMSLQSPTTSASIRPWRDCLAYAAQHGLRPALLTQS